MPTDPAAASSVISAKRSSPSGLPPTPQASRMAPEGSRPHANGSTPDGGGLRSSSPSDHVLRLRTRDVLAYPRPYSLLMGWTS